MRGVTALFGPSGSGKTTRAALRRRPADAARRRSASAARSGRTGATSGRRYQRRGRLCVPGSEPVPASLGAGQSALWPAAGARRGRGRDALRRGRGAARDGGPARAGAAAPLGRRAPAGGDRPRAALATAAAPDGRAARRARPLQQGRDPALSRGACTRRSRSRFSTSPTTSPRSSAWPIIWC